MKKDYINFILSSNVILILVIILIIILIIALISSILKKNKENKKEKQSSILDVDLNGVPASYDRTFNYGYEKEDTIVMEPVKAKKKNKKEQKK